MTPLDKIKKAKVDIMRHKMWCAMSGVLACGETIVTEEVPTAATNGWNKYFNPGFVDTLTPEELRLLLLHEATHAAYRHLTLWKPLWDENKRLTNIAADHFVNLSLMDSDAGEGFLKMPKCGIQPEAKYRGWSVKQIFGDLKANPPPDGQGGEPEGLDEHDFEGAGEQSEELTAAQAQEIDRAMRQGEIVRRKRGDGAGTANGVFGDLLTAKVDWREVLREFVQSTCAGKDESTWRKPNRKFLGDDVYMPSMESTHMEELVVVMDTSGSCFGTEEATRFVSEMQAIVEQVRPAKTTIMYVDSRVAGSQEFFDGQFEVQSVKPKGGGGTDMPAAFAWCAEKHIQPAAMVILTDGYTPWGIAPNYPVLWAITSNLRSPWGVTVCLQ